MNVAALEVGRAGRAVGTSCTRVGRGARLWVAHASALMGWVDALERTVGDWVDTSLVAPTFPGEWGTRCPTELPD
ncbi:hypothetical protein ACFQJ5_09720 [Halomicroarcula sp. GCM10025324]|uniref:hypothetical protein n=1 Tax=Haloarcula TaxID=2237 RepID=UPI0023E78FA9|nr:hypothetical protein [Halomicroarcula sp. ZS-22-S1]